MGSSTRSSSEDYEFIPEVRDRFLKDYKASGLLYRQFIEVMSLGLVSSIPRDYESLHGTNITSDYYKVIDKEKWFLSKIKYGI